MKRYSGGELVVRWFVGVALIIAARLLLEPRLPSGAAMGIGFAAFMFLWIPTVPAEAYRTPGRRGLLLSRMALFLVAAAVAALAYPPLSQVVARS